MSELQNEFIEAVLNANNAVLDTEDQARRWAQQRSYLARAAHRHGVSVEQIATGTGQTSRAVEEWLVDGADAPESIDALPDWP